MRKHSITMAALLLLGSAVFAQHQHGGKAPAHKPAAAHKPVVWKMICPVTGDKIASVQAAGARSVYKGKIYLFCCPGCKPTFDKNPEKIIADASKGKFQPM